MKKLLFKIFALLFAVTAGGSGTCFAQGIFTFKDMEKPAPQFTRSDDVITAKLIPRAKNNSVEIRFAVASGGHLAQVKGVDFFSIDGPGVDVKNFKSAAFEIRVDNVATGGEAEISVSSDFFSSATQFYVFNAKLETPWMKDKSVNTAKEERIRALQVVVKDGGPLDSDGAANGRITLIGGPRDSFWGYALGTLFIRFFGIFLVLTILMIGMIISGLIFSRMGERKKGETENSCNQMVSSSDVPETTSAKSIDAETSSSEPTEEEAAAIATALHLHFRTARKDLVADKLGFPGTGVWSGEGRKRIMNDRLMVFRHRR